jgi:hypothetical protein
MLRQKRAHFTLKADRVFKNMPEAKAAFDHWKALRDKHIAHNDSEWTHLVSTLVLGPEAEVQDILSLQISPLLSPDDGSNQNLFNLIDHTRKHVLSEIDALLPRAFEEAKHMTPAERLALPPVAYSAPTAEKATQTRSRKRPSKGEAPS